MKGTPVNRLRSILATALLGLSPILASAQTLAPGVGMSMGSVTGSNSVQLDPAAMSENMDRILFDAERGSSAAQLQMGLIYSYGIGVFKDPEKAAYWFEQSAGTGNTLAQLELATLMLNGYTTAGGRVVPPDEKSAFLLVSQAAATGSREALAVQGGMYMKGLPSAGISADVAHARALFLRAAEQGATAGLIGLAELQLRAVEQDVAAQKGAVAQLDEAQLARLGIAWGTLQGLGLAGVDAALETLQRHPAADTLVHKLFSPTQVTRLQASGVRITLAFGQQPLPAMRALSRYFP